MFEAGSQVFGAMTHLRLISWMIITAGICGPANAQESSHVFGCELSPTGDRVGCIRYRYRIGDEDASLAYVVFDLNRRELSSRLLERTKFPPAVAAVSPTHRAYVYSTGGASDLCVRMMTSSGSTVIIGFPSDKWLSSYGWTGSGTHFVLIGISSAGESYLYVYDDKGSLVSSARLDRWRAAYFALSPDLRTLYLVGNKIELRTQDPDKAIQGRYLEDVGGPELRALDLGSTRDRVIRSLDGYMRLEYCDGKRLVYTTGSAWYRSNIDETDKSELGHASGKPNWIAKRSLRVNGTNEEGLVFKVEDLSPVLLESTGGLASDLPRLPAGVTATARRTQEHGKSAAATEGYVWELTITNGTGKKAKFEYSISRTLEDYWFQGPIEVDAGATKKVDLFIPHGESPDPASPIIQVRFSTDWTGEWMELADDIYWNYWHNGRELIFGIMNRGQGKIKADVTFTFGPVGDSRTSWTENTGTLDGSGEAGSVWRLHRSITNRGKPPVKVTEFKIHYLEPTPFGTWVGTFDGQEGRELILTLRPDKTFRQTSRVGNADVVVEGDFSLSGDTLTTTIRSVSLVPPERADIAKSLIGRSQSRRIVWQGVDQFQMAQEKGPSVTFRRRVSGG